MSEDAAPTYSISVRLQRTTLEEAYVSVPVTGDVMDGHADKDGSFHLDPEKVMAAAVALGREADWAVEERSVSVHPVQKAPPTV